MSRTGRIGRAAAVAAAMAGAVLLGAPAEAHYSFVTLAFPGAISTTADGIDNAGEVVGLYANADLSVHAFSYSHGAYSTLNLNLPSDVASHLIGLEISPNGQVIGGNYSPTGTTQHGFVLNGGSYAAVDQPGAANTAIVGVNDNGQAAGFFGASKTTPFLYSGGAITPLSPPNLFRGRASWIDAAGDVVGTYAEIGIGSVGFLCPSGGTCQDLAVPGALSTAARAIDDAGDVFGSYNDGSLIHGFVDSGGTYSTIDVPGAVATALVAVSGNGEAVGNSDQGAFSFKGGVLQLLNLKGATDSSAFGVNDAGQVIGDWSPDGATVFSYLASPTPEASTWAMMLIGFGGLGAALRRRLVQPSPASTPG
jgi:hypothetical protein